VGTPTVVAPGAIFLVGEFGLPEEEVAVLARALELRDGAVLPDVSPVFAPGGRRGRSAPRPTLGEAACGLACGLGSAQPAKAPTDGQGLTFDTAPAIAVATAAAIFETAGQSISERKR